MTQQPYFWGLAPLPPRRWACTNAYWALCV